MKVSIIVATAKNNAIGKDNDLIWHLPKDMRFFMDTTKGHHVIMGRKNYDSIPEKYRPLKDRTNIIVTRQEDLSAPGCIIVNSIERGIDIARKSNDTQCFIIGGGQIYQKALELDLVDKMYITHIDEEFDGDTHFPFFDKSKWEEKTIMEHKADYVNVHDFIVKEYTRK